MLIFAVFVDILLGEYPNIIHPVAYMGKIGKLFDKYVNNKGQSKSTRFLSGLCAEMIEISVWCCMLIFLRISLKSKIIEYVILTCLLKATFSIRGLYEHVRKCSTDNIAKLRKSVSMIVSRGTEKLDKPHLYSAAIESLSENISDSITAPLFYYILFGLDGALIYRIVNTYDALFGYHSEKYEWFGKFCARLDDALNFIPARITAFLILLFSPKNAWKYIKKYGSIKINATHPMSAFAGVLQIGIEKIGYYRFDGQLPQKEDLKRALILYIKVVSLILIIAVLILILKLLGDRA